MPVVTAELGVGALERRVTVSLGLLDTTVPNMSAFPSLKLIMRICV